MGCNVLGAYYTLTPTQEATTSHAHRYYSQPKLNDHMTRQNRCHTSTTHTITWSLVGLYHNISLSQKNLSCPTS